MGNEIAKQENGKRPEKTIFDLLKSEEGKRNLALALPRHLTVDRFSRIAQATAGKNPALAKCTIASLWECVQSCAQLGIEPDGRKAHLIPYGNQCTLIIDYKGLVDLARRSGEISYIHADVVCENDQFDYAYGSGAHLNHIPATTERGKPTHAYSFVKLKDGAEDFCVMNVDEVDAIRGRSKAGKAGPWVTDWNEMAKKTVFRRHSKWLPLSSEFQEAIEKDFDVPTDLIDPARVGKPVVAEPKALEPQEQAATTAQPPREREAGEEG